MARAEKKRVELKPVDDEVRPVAEVVRLENPETSRKPKPEAPVRLGPSDTDRTTSRLNVPSRDEVELRTHQPGIEVLIESTSGLADPTEEGWGEVSARRYPIPWGWFALIGFAIIGAVAWSLSHIEEAEVQADHLRDETESVLAREEREEEEARELVERIEASLRGFFAASTVDVMALRVRHPDRVLPLMRRHYAREPLRSVPLRSVKVLQPITLENRANFWMASVLLSDGETRNLVIEIAPQGDPRIDWETLVCDQPMPWDRFAMERPAGKSMDFRVYAERDMFFSHEFADAGRWLCFRLTALDSEETLFGYAATDSAEARELLEVIEKNGGRRVSVILRLGIPEGLQSRRGVVIEKMLGSRWLYLDSPDASS